MGKIDIYMTLLKNKSRLLPRRRELRKNQTRQEEILWKHIRNRKLGLKFKRQYSMGGYILDFFWDLKIQGVYLRDATGLDLGGKNKGEDIRDFLKMWGCNK